MADREHPTAPPPPASAAPSTSSPDRPDLQRTLIDAPGLDLAALGLARSPAAVARTPTPTAVDALLPDFAATLPVDASGAMRSPFADTAPAPSVPALAVATSPTGEGPAQSIGRTTVLPRVHLSGGQARLERPVRRRYEEGVALGRGGIGEVVSAVDNDIGRPVALKRLRPDRLSPADLARFVEEVRLVGALEHPHIVPIHDVGQDEQGAYYFVMKYVQGETLGHIIERLAAGDPAYHRRWPFERRVALFLQILEAIAHAHGRGILHRDIKPANVLVTTDGDAVVVDWGLATALGGAATAERDALLARVLGTSEADVQAGGVHMTTLGAVVGTPLYMSPEQARGEPLDARSDVYSLSLLFHELLTLRHHLADKPSVTAVLAGVLIDDPPFASLVRNPHQGPVPMDLGWFVRDGLAKDRDRRYPSVEAMIDRLRLRAEGIIPVQCHITLIKRVMRTWLRTIDRFPIAFSVSLLAFVLGFLGVTTALVVLLVRS